VLQLFFAVGFQKSVKIIKQLRCFDAESDGDRLKCPQADFFPAYFQIGDIVLVDSRLLSKINLSPSTLLTEFTNPFAERDANVTCHPPYSRIILEDDSRL